MSCNNRYDVTTWPLGDPAEDIGEVINSIIADVKARQTVADRTTAASPAPSSTSRPATTASAPR